MTSPNILVLYHAKCPDGFTSAWAAYKKFGDAAEYVAVFHGDEPPDVKGKEVYVLDFAYPLATTLRMIEEAKSFVLLDHHKTAKAALEGTPGCTFDMDRSGAGMSWDYFHTEPRPLLVDCVEDRDLWN